MYVLACGLIINLGSQVIRLIAERGFKSALDRLHTLLPTFRISLLWCGVYLYLGIWPCKLLLATPFFSFSPALMCLVPKVFQWVLASDLCLKAGAIADA